MSLIEIIKIFGPLIASAVCLGVTGWITVLNRTYATKSDVNDLGNRIVTVEAKLESYPVPSDLREKIANMDKTLAHLEAEVETGMAGMKEDVSNLRGEMRSAFSDLRKTLDNLIFKR
jgi:hypothetical protein